MSDTERDPVLDAFLNGKDEPELNEQPHAAQEQADAVMEGLHQIEAEIVAEEEAAAKEAAEKTKPKKKVKAKSKAKVSKKPAAKKAKSAPVGTDDFGFRKGSIRSKAAAMYASAKGATLSEIFTKLGSVQYNMLNDLKERGFKITSKEEDGKANRPATRYFLKGKKR